MKLIHLWATLVVLCILGGAIAVGIEYANGIEEQYIHAIAPLNPDIAIKGIALQKEALRHSDLLPIYGASEAIRQQSEFQADQFFKNYPTGFAPFELAHVGSASIVYAETAAALGPDLNGKAVVISFAPSQFTSKMMNETYYAVLFSHLHANALAFSDQLDYSTKQLIARRMLQYPDTLQSDPVLKFALEQLANDTPLSTVFYTLVYPIGKLQTAILELQDHYQTLTYIWSLKNVPTTIPHQTAPVDWKALIDKAQQEQIPFSSNNPYGFDNKYWDANAHKFKVRPIPSGDPGFLKSLDNSAEWGDLELLLHILKQYGAKPLLLGRPLNTDYFHALGVSDLALDHYFTKLDSLAAQYNVPVVDFKDFQDITYFGIDPSPHTSRKGWVYVDQSLDEFYHQVTH